MTVRSSPQFLALPFALLAIAVFFAVKEPAFLGPRNLTQLIVEFSIVESDSMKAGISCSLVEMETLQGYAGNVLSFVAGVLGVSIDELKADDDFENVFGAVVGSDQLFTGMLVKCIAQKVPTKKGGEYTAKSWLPVHAEDYAKYDREAPSGAPSKLAA